MIERYGGIIYTLREYLAVILLFLVLFSLGIYQIIKVGSPIEIKLSTELDEIVTDVYSLRSRAYVQVENKEERIKIDYSRNYDYEPAELNEFLEIGDKIIKNKCSDTLHIFRNESRFFFLIGDILLNSNHRSKEFVEKWRKRRTIINERNDCG